MKKVLILIVIGLWIFKGVPSFANYNTLIKKLVNCEKYEYIDYNKNNEEFRYKVAGRQGNLCKYIEKDMNGMMVCLHTKKGINVLIKYLTNVFIKGDIHTQLEYYNDIENVRATECCFDADSEADDHFLCNGLELRANK